jgi:uncharacterized membrane protein
VAIHQQVSISLCKWLTYALFIYCLSFLIGGLVTPVLIRFGFPSMADGLYDLFSAACQQRPTRTFWMAGYPLALCSRCMGVYSGIAISSLLCLNRDAFRVSVGLIVGLVLFAVGEKLAEWSGCVADNTVRFVAGLALGESLFLLVHFLVGKIMMRVRYYVKQVEIRLPF